MSEDFLFKILNGDIDIQHVLLWLQNEPFVDADFTTPCSRIDFVLYLLSFLRNQTSSILQASTLTNKFSVQSLDSLASDSVTIVQSKSNENQHNFNSSLKQENDSKPNDTSQIQNTYKNDKVSTYNHVASEGKLQSSGDINENLRTPTKNESSDSILSNISPICEEEVTCNKFDVRFSTPNNSITSSKRFDTSSPFNKSFKTDYSQSDIQERKSYVQASKSHGLKNSRSQHNENRYPHNHSIDGRTNNHNGGYFQPEKPTSNRTNICIGDFIVSKSNASDKNVSVKKKKHKYVNLSLNEMNFIFNDQTPKAANAFDVQDESSFPEIGNNKPFHRHQPRRRINPTRLNLSDQTPNNHHVSEKPNIKFGIKCDKVEQNEAFKNQIFQTKELDRCFNMERNILKLEKEKLLQKFGTLNSPKSKSCSTILNKIPTSGVMKPISKQRSTDSTLLVIPDPTSVTHSKALDTLSLLYGVILNLNFIVNYTSEINFLISLLISQTSVANPDKNMEHNSECQREECSLELASLLKSLHNCVYFSVKAIQHQISIMDSILDNNSLKLLQQNNRLKLFCPELTEHLKFICDERQNTSENLHLQSIVSNKNVCFNTETDSEENFQSQQGFYTFKKQRDLFYEILRTWENQHNSPNWSFNIKLGGMIRTLINMSFSPSNVAHLALLFREQLMTMCTGRKTIDEDSLPEVAGASADRLNKLAQRLVAAPTQNVTRNNSKPDFPECQEFFRDFLIVADHSSFRQHVADSLLDEIHRLNSNHFTSTDSDEIVSNKIKAQYLGCVISLQLLGKFLGFVISLPYRIPVVVNSTAGQRHIVRDIPTLSQVIVPKEKVLQTNITVRQQSQPQINLVALINQAKENNKLILTVPWVVQMLTMLDYSTLRLPYYRNIIFTLFQIYLDSSFTFHHLSPKSNCKFTKQSQTLLKICLGWFFDMQHFPQELFYSWIKMCDTEMLHKSFSNLELTNELSNVSNTEQKELRGNELSVSKTSIGQILEEHCGGDVKLDMLDFIDCNVLVNVCPHLKDLRVILVCNKEASDGTDHRTYRHITPVTSSLTEDNLKIAKRKQLQVHLEEWFLRSQSQSTSRMLRSISERVGSALLRLIRTQIPQLKVLSTQGVANILQNFEGVQAESEIRKFNFQLLSTFKVRCVHAAKCCGRERTKAALQGMLPPATPKPVFDLLLELALRRAIDSCYEWLNTNTSIDMLTFETSLENVKITKTITTKEMQEYFDIDNIKSKNDKHIDGDKKKVLVGNVDVEEIFHSGAQCIVKLKELCVQLISGAALQNDVENFKLIFQECVTLAETCSRCCYIQTPTLRVIGQLCLDFVVLIICLFSAFITDDILNKLKTIWTNCLLAPTKVDDKISVPFSDNSEDKNIDDKEIEIFQNYVCNGKVSQTTASIGDINESLALLEEDNASHLNKSAVNETQNSFLNDSETIQVKKSDKQRVYNEFFDSILCPRNIMYFGELGRGTSDVWKKLAHFLSFLLKNRFISEESITEQCLAVYRQDWPQLTLEGLSSCVKELSQIHPLSSDKLRLFLDFVLEFCQNIGGDFLNSD